MKNRVPIFPPKADDIFDAQKVAKRTAYYSAYCLLTFAYLNAYSAAYLPFSGRAENAGESHQQPALWREKLAPHRPACGFFQHGRRGQNEPTIA
jgi:hypothetical protein